MNWGGDYASSVKVTYFPVFPVNTKISNSKETNWQCADKKSETMYILGTIQGIQCEHVIDLMLNIVWLWL